MNIKETSTAILKIVLIWVIAMEAEVAAIIYDLYMTILDDGIRIVTEVSGDVSLLCDLPLTNGRAAQDYSDLYTRDGIEYPYRYSVIHNLDCLASRIFAVNESNESGRLLTAITGMFALGTAIPGGPLLGGGMIAIALMTFVVFTRTVLTYLIAVVGISFYLMMSPIFISFALFKSTNHMFEKWLQQVTSFALQPVLIFAYLMLAEAYIENVIDSFPSVDELVAQVGVLERDVYSSNINVPMDRPVWLNDPTAQPDPNNCPPGSNCFVDPDDAESGGAAMMVFGGLAATGLLNWATIVFLDLVPEVARQLASASRSIRIGGGQNDPTFSPSGAAVNAPVFDQMQNFVKGAQNQNKSNQTELWSPDAYIAGMNSVTGTGGQRGGLRDRFLQSMFPYS